MLLLGRATQERIQIGENIVLVVAEIRKNYVRIGIEAPKELDIKRLPPNLDRPIKRARRNKHPRFGDLGA